MPDVFDPEQQASIREVLPAGADDVRIEVRGDDVTSPGRERKYMPGDEWALHFLDQLAVCHREWIERQTGSISFKDKRDGWKRIAKGFQRELAKIAPPLEADGYARKLRQLSEEVAGLIAGCDRMVKENTYPKNSHRELIYGHLLDVWALLGGKLSVTHDNYQDTTAGPLVLYFKLAASLVFGEAPLPSDTIDGIVDREKRRREGKPPRVRESKRRQN